MSIAAATATKLDSQSTREVLTERGGGTDLSTGGRRSSERLGRSGGGAPSSPAPSGTPPGAVAVASSRACAGSVPDDVSPTASSSSTSSWCGGRWFPPEASVMPSA
ncbi:hypothetical protein GCM10009573_12870 [Agromyces bracchium]